MDSPATRSRSRVEPLVSEVPRSPPTPSSVRCWWAGRLRSRLRFVGRVALIQGVSHTTHGYQHVLDRAGPVQGRRRRRRALVAHVLRARRSRRSAPARCRSPCSSDSEAVVGRVEHRHDRPRAGRHAVHRVQRVERPARRLRARRRINVANIGQRRSCATTISVERRRTPTADGLAGEFNLDCVARHRRLRPAPAPSTAARSAARPSARPRRATRAVTASLAAGAERGPVLHWQHQRFVRALRRPRAPWGRPTAGDPNPARARPSRPSSPGAPRRRSWDRRPTAAGRPRG